MEINDLTPAEQRVWRAFATGTEVDLRGDGEQSVRAAVVRALLLNGPREAGR